MLKQSLISLVFLLVFCEYVESANCPFSLVYPSPMQEVTVSSRKFLIYINGNNFVLREGESVTWKCPTTYVISKEQSWNSSTVSFKCVENGDLNVATLIDNFDNRISYGTYNSFLMQCKAAPEMKLFGDESNSNNHCKQFISYGIGESKDSIEMAICYDMDKLSFQHAAYMSSELKKFDIPEKVYLKGYHNLTAVKNAEVLQDSALFLTSDQFGYEYKQKQIEFSSLANVEFVYDDILLSNLMTNKYYEYATLRKVVWSKALRDWSWSKLNRLLEKHISDKKFLVTVGTSGKLQFYVNPNVNGEFMIPLIIERDAFLVEAFEYVWTTVKSLEEGIEEEYVFIGFNSPFGSKKRICRDICNEISWLNQDAVFMKTHRRKESFVSCCSMQELSMKYADFPYNWTKLDTQNTIQV